MQENRLLYAIRIAKSGDVPHNSPFHPVSPVPMASPSGSVNCTILSSPPEGTGKLEAPRTAFSHFHPGGTAYATKPQVWAVLDLNNPALKFHRVATM